MSDDDLPLFPDPSPAPRMAHLRVHTGAMPTDETFVECCTEGDIMFCGDPRDPETGEPTFYTVSEVGITQALRDTEET